MQVLAVPCITRHDIRGRDFSFKIDSKVAKPYNQLTSISSPRDIQTEPIRVQTKSYGGIDENFEAAKDATHKITFALVNESKSVYGYAMAFKDWNNLVTLHDFAVSGELRGKGYGKMLFNAVRNWAQDLGVKGLRIETQDNNVTACQFYTGCGAVFGGYDEYLYHGTGNASETAMYWYCLFD